VQKCACHYGWRVLKADCTVAHTQLVSKCAYTGTWIIFHEITKQFSDKWPVPLLTHSLWANVRTLAHEEDYLKSLDSLAKTGLYHCSHTVCEHKCTYWQVTVYLPSLNSLVKRPWILLRLILSKVLVNGYSNPPMPQFLIVAVAGFVHRMFDQLQILIILCNGRSLCSA
jgi:ribosomal protein L32